VRLQQVAAARLAIGAPDDDVRMDPGLALVQRDVADERENFHLLAERNLRVVLRGAVEVAERHVAEGADRREVRGAHVL